eukprot:TRINITY_DN121814_c0_g1_i1.p1 TRINITY_DN121814_c0_g1~~TRINITY_DN121814_c0_g1_i1.p1  ORF type:complete len:384 (+),score=28.11 TRINITY_DN121814_c0_g1_i1:41-1153(+)
MGCGTSRIQLRRSRPSGKDEYKLILWKTSPDESLGLSLLDADDGAMQIAVIKPDGLVAHFIRTNPDMVEKHMQVGYTIVAVNDVVGDCAAMRNELEEKILVELRVARTTVCLTSSTPVMEIGRAEHEPQAPLLDTSSPTQLNYGAAMDSLRVAAVPAQKEEGQRCREEEKETEEKGGLRYKPEPTPRKSHRRSSKEGHGLRLRDNAAMSDAPPLLGAWTAKPVTDVRGGDGEAVRTHGAAPVFRRGRRSSKTGKEAVLVTPSGLPTAYSVKHMVEGCVIPTPMPTYVRQAVASAGSALLPGFVDSALMPPDQNDAVYSRFGRSGREADRNADMFGVNWVEQRRLSKQHDEEIDVHALSASECCVLGCRRP